MSRVPPERLLKPSTETDGDNLYGVCRERGSHRMMSGYYRAGFTGPTLPCAMCKDCPRIEVGVLSPLDVFERPDFRPFA